MTDFADDCDYSTIFHAHEEGFMSGWIGRKESRNPYSFYTARSAHAAWFEAWCAGRALHNPDDMSADRQSADLDVYLSTVSI